jgi:polyketide cyclase/dehydrase/lipid transport protein
MSKAYASSVIPAPAAAVWSVIRDFNALPAWHPAIATSEIEDGRASDQVGAIRSFKLTDGAHIRERLLDLSDVAMTCVYNFETTIFDVEDYLATLRCTPITDGDACFIEWWATFDCAPDAVEEFVDTFANGVFQPGFDALKAHFEHRG